VEPLSKWFQKMVHSKRWRSKTISGAFQVTGNNILGLATPFHLSLRRHAIVSITIHRPVKKHPGRAA